MNIFTWLIVKPMGFILELIYSLVQNYGAAIIIFTILIKLLILPLNLKSQKSMAKQQKLAPQLQELQRKYANDKEKLNKEMMELYRANGANPASGCLPTFLQFPIIIGLYHVIQKPLSFMLGVNFNLPENINKVIEMQQIVANTPDLSAVPNGFTTMTMEQLANRFQIEMSNFASNPVFAKFNDWIINFNFLGLDLSKYPKEAVSPLLNLLMGRISPSLLETLPLLLIPILSGLSAWAISKVSSANNPQTSVANGSSADGAASMSQSMMLMMPILSVVFAFSLPSGIGLYWIVSNIVQLIQQHFTMRYFKKKEENSVVIDTIKKNRKDRKKHR